MGAYDTILACSVGGAGLQATGYNYVVKPELRDNEVASLDVTLDVEGYIEGSTPSDLAAKVEAFVGAARAGGVNVTLTGVGGVAEQSIVAARCLDGGPAIEVKVGEGISPLQRRVSLKATAKEGAGDEVTIAEQTWHAFESRKVATETRPDGLRRVTISGELKGPNVEAVYAQAVLPRDQSAFPWPSWVLSSRRREVNTAGDRMTYSLSADEMSDADRLREAAGGVARMEDVSQGERRDRDERGRLVTTYAWDALVTGDPRALEPVIRPAVGAILRESFEVGRGRERRIRASYTVLTSAAGNDLVEWEQTVEWMQETAAARPVTYDGIGVKLIYVEAQYYTLRVSGRAVGLGRFPIEPAPPRVGAYVLTAPPVVRHRKINDYEYETTWASEQVGVSGFSVGNGFIPLTGRPGEPRFYGG